MNFNFSVKSTFAFLNVCFVIASSGYVLTTTVYSPIIYNLLFFVGLANLIFICFSKSTPRLNTLSPAFCLFLFLIVLATTTTFFNPSPANFFSNFKFLFLVFFCFTLVICYRPTVLIKLYMEIIYWVCVISLFGYFIVNGLALYEMFPLVYNSNDIAYRSAFFFYSFDGFLSFRNIGVFWEPGVFATMIYFALMLDIYFKYNSYKTFQLVLIVSLITTFSSAGFILFLLYLVFLVLNSSVRFNFKEVFLYVIVVSVLVAVTYTMMDIVSNVGVDPMRVFNKISSYEDNESHRLMSPTLSLNLFLEKPFFGWGMVDGMLKYVEIGNISLTSTSTYYLMAFGVLGSLLIIIPIIFFSTMYSFSFLERMLLFVSYFFIQNKEPHVYFSLSYIVLFYMFIHLANSVYNGRNAAWLK